MSSNKSNKDRLVSLIRNPNKHAGKIIPFLKSRITPVYRHFLEFFHVYKLSKPYSNHGSLIKEINLRDGFFVQCGGNDGYGNDPTYYLEKALGWKGIIVEPLPIYKLCQRNRRKSKVYNNATGSIEDRHKKVSFIDCNAMSFVKNSIDNEKEWINAGEKSQNIKAETFETTLVPIQDIIDDYFSRTTAKKIDLFVADTEGYEFSVIKGLDFAKNSPTYLLLEIHKDSELALITDYLERQGYVMLQALEQRDFLFKKTK